MEQTYIYLLAEGLVNLNIRTYESTNAILMFTTFAFFFFIIVTAYLAKNLHIVTRVIMAAVAIFFNLALTLTYNFQAKLAQALLNTLSKLAAEGQAPIFKEDLLAQGLEPGSDLTNVELSTFKIFIFIVFILGFIAPVYLYIFAKWHKD